MEYKYLVINMADMDMYNNYEPLLSTYRGHSSNGKTILKFSIENAPNNDNLLNEDQYQQLMASSEWTNEN